MYTPTRNDRKMGAAILHIARQAQVRGVSGVATKKLYKLLFLVDFNAYGEWGEPVTGSLYRHFAMGPVPVEYPRVIAGLVDHGLAVVQEIPSGMPRPEKRVVALGAGMEGLDGREVSLIDHILSEYGHMSGTALERLTHEMKPWRYTEDGAVIPFEFAFAMEREAATADDMLWAKRVLDGSGGKQARAAA